MNLEKLNISFNFLLLRHINGIFWDRLHNLRELDLSYQTYILRDPTTSVVLFLPPFLSSLVLSNSRFLDEDYPMVIKIQNRTALSSLKCQGNSLRYIYRVILFDPDLTILFEADFSNNKLESFPGLSHNPGFNVNSLILHDNKLGEQTEKDWIRSLNRLENFTQLDLTSNEIKQLPHAIFKNQQNMKYLNLSKSSFSFVTFQIFQMKKHSIN